MGCADFMNIREKELHQLIAMIMKGHLSCCKRNFRPIQVQLINRISNISIDFSTLIGLLRFHTINLLDACLILNSLRCLRIFIRLTMVCQPLRIRRSVSLKGCNVVIVILSLYYLQQSKSLFICCRFSLFYLLCYSCSLNCLLSSCLSICFSLNSSFFHISSSLLCLFFCFLF